MAQASTQLYHPRARTVSATFTRPDNTTGTTTTLNVTSGTVDGLQTRKSRTWTTVTIDDGGILRYDPSVVTVTNKVAPASCPMQISAVGV